MRWFIVFTVALAFLLVGWTVGQKAQNDDVAQKIEALEKRLAEAERKISELERKVAELRKQLAQMGAIPKFFVVPPPSLVPPSLVPPSPFPFGRQIPEERHGFGLPKPAPFPFVQPYYYPLEGQTK